MHIVDITMFYGATSGGVKRYLDAKRAWLLRQPGVRHSLVVPGARTTGRAGGVVTLEARAWPGMHGYRLPLDVGLAADALAQLEPDVIEAGDPYTYGWAATRAAQRLGASSVAFLHSDVEELAARSFGALPSRLVRQYLANLYNRFDELVAPSHAIARRMPALGVRRVVEIQPLGVDTDVFTPAVRSDALRRLLGLDRDTRILVYAGRFAPEKNLWVLSKALRYLGTRYCLVTIGSGPRPAIGSNVRVLPYVGSSTVLARYLAGADLFVHAGDQETFGLAVLEAMACGLPVVCVGAGAMTDLVDAAVGFTVPPGRPGDFAAAVEAIFESDPASLGANARQRALWYDWNCLLPALLARYRTLAACRAPGWRIAQPQT